MARSLFRQDTQVHKSGLYKDDLAISGAESSATNLEDDLNYIRSVLLDLKGGTNWHDAAADTITQLAANTTLAEKRITYLVQNVADITVPNAQNWVVLADQATPVLGELPTDPIAINAGTEGAVVAQLAGALGSHSLLTTTNDANLCQIRTASTNEPIYESGSGRQIYALLQVASTATDGANFDAGNNQAQLSFVTINPATEGLVAATIADIEDQVLEYAYRCRTNLNDMPENILDGTFVSADAVAPTSVTLDNAYNGGAFVTVDNNNVEWRLTDTKAFEVTDSGSVNIFAVNAAAGGDSVVATIKTLDINNTDVADFSNGISVDTGATTITVDNGAVTSTGAMSFASSTSTAQLSGASNVTVVSSAGEVYLDDSRTAALPLSDASHFTLFGSATSILGAIDAAGAAGGVDLTLGRVVVNSGGITANTTITASNTTQLTDAPAGLIAYANVAEFTDCLLIYINGALMASGETSGANNDVYAAGTAASGQFACEFDLEEGDVIQIVKLVQ